MGNESAFHFPTASFRATFGERGQERAERFMNIVFWVAQIILAGASSKKSALKPYWGKSAVRNFGGDYGNGGIIRSLPGAIALLD
jgi:hypothetical protein